MKVEKTATPRPSFQPISITITIETEEELRALQLMVRHNVSIPNLMNTRDEEKIIHDFLGMIQDTIIE